MYIVIHYPLPPQKKKNEKMYRLTKIQIKKKERKTVIYLPHMRQKR